VEIFPTTLGEKDPNMTIYSPYFYIIQDKRNGIYYAGAQWAKLATPSTLMTINGYQTSSKVIKSIINSHGLVTFLIRKIKIFDTANDTYDYEKKFLTKVKAAQNDKFYNNHDNDWKFFDNTGKATVIDSFGFTFQVATTNPDYVSGKLTGATKGKKPGRIIETGETSVFDVHDIRWNTGELESLNKTKSQYLDASDNYVYTTREEAINLGYTSFSANKISVKDKDGNTFQINKDDDRFISGELVGVTTGMNTVFDSKGHSHYVSKYDSRILSGEFKQFTSGMVVVKDKDGRTQRVSVTDEKYLSGELKGITSGLVLVKYSDRRNNDKFYVNKMDIRYISGELVPWMRGMKKAEDNYGNIVLVYPDDTRLNTGELKYQVNKRTAYYNNNKINKLISIGDTVPNGFIKGKLPSRNRKIYTNGITNKTVWENDSPPSGFWPGRTLTTLPKKCYTDGVTNIKILKSESPPSGFVAGMTHYNKRKTSKLCIVN
jgi:hypothetical protein